jgi:hypothetical protein
MALQCVPPELKGAGWTHQREPNGLSDTPYPLDQVSPIAILKRQFRRDNGSIGRRIEQSSSRDHSMVKNCHRILD